MKAELQRLSPRLFTTTIMLPAREPNRSLRQPPAHTACHERATVNTLDGHVAIHTPLVVTPATLYGFAGILPQNVSHATREHCHCYAAAMLPPLTLYVIYNSVITPAALRHFHCRRYHTPFRHNTIYSVVCYRYTALVLRFTSEAGRLLSRCAPVTAFR